jgi:hypothetical protein
VEVGSGPYSRKLTLPWHQRPLGYLSQPSHFVGFLQMRSRVGARPLLFRLQIDVLHHAGVVHFAVPVGSTTATTLSLNANVSL